MNSCGYVLCFRDILYMHGGTKLLSVLVHTKKEAQYFLVWRGNQLKKYEKVGRMF